MIDDAARAEQATAAPQDVGFAAADVRLGYWPTGHQLVVVKAPNQEQRTAATGFLRAHGGHNMRSYSDNTLEDPWRPEAPRP